MPEFAGMTEVSRRSFLGRAGIAAGGASLGLVAGGASLGLVAACTDSASTRNGAPAATPFDPHDWDSVRDQFALSRDLLQFAAFVLASPPRQVSDSITGHRARLDEDTNGYLNTEEPALDSAVLTAAANYLETDPDSIAFTDSTTMGLGLVYNGIRLSAGQEILTSDHDFYATHEALRMRAARDGVGVRRVALYDYAGTASVDQIVTRLGGAISPATRAVALTWVHSGTGVKLPVTEIAAEIASRATALGIERPLLCLDGVHGFGVEDMSPADLGCDFLISGAHKWLFGPRGTGFVWASAQSWAELNLSIPSFAPGIVGAYIQNLEPVGVAPGAAATPGGYKAFEHRWALAEAFDFHQALGRDRVAERTRVQASQLKEGLADMAGVRVVTPSDPELSSGIVCLAMEDAAIFDLPAVLREQHGVIASITPYNLPLLRLGPSIVTSPDDVEAAIRAIDAVR